MKKQIKPVLRVAVAAATCLGALGGLAACAVSPASAGSDFGNSGANAVTSDEAPGLFVSEIKRFPQPLPDGIEWPNVLPGHLREDNVEMQATVPRAMVSFYWLCAWEDKYLTSSEAGQGQSSDHALDMVSKFMDLPFYEEQYDDPEQLWYSNVVVEARNGNNSGVRSDLQQCGYFYENQK